MFRTFRPRTGHVLGQILGLIYVVRIPLAIFRCRASLPHLRIATQFKYLSSKTQNRWYIVLAPSHGTTNLLFITVSETLACKIYSTASCMIPCRSPTQRQSRPTRLTSPRRQRFVTLLGHLFLRPSCQSYGVSSCSEEHMLSTALPHF